MLAGRNPYPPPDFEPRGANLIWPPLVAYVLSPLTFLPPGAADLVMVVAGLACFALTLWRLGVRDWRVYGVVALWPQVAGEMRVAHLTAPICLLVALAWRSRNERVRGGIPVGIAAAAKFLVWPVALWLLARARPLAAVLAATIGLVSLPPGPRVHEPRRLRSRAPEARPRIRPGLVHALRAARAERGFRGDRADRSLHGRRGPARRDLALPEPHVVDRSRAHALADRLAGLLRPRDRPACDRPTATLARVVPPARNVGAPRRRPRHR